jgi:hypothetical protein
LSAAAHEPKRRAQLIFRWLVISKAPLVGIALSKDDRPSFLIDIGTHTDEFLSFWKFKTQDAAPLPAVPMTGFDNCFS